MMVKAVNEVSDLQELKKFRHINSCLTCLLDQTGTQRY